MPATMLLSLAIFAPAVSGLAGMLLPRKSLGGRTALAVVGPLVTLVALGWVVAQGNIDRDIAPVPWLSGFRLDWDLHADKLAIFFALLVGGIGLLITLYSRAYFGPDQSSLFRFYPALHLFMTAMLGLALSDNFMLLLLFWELTSISSFLLIGWDREDADSVNKALQAFVVTAAGGLALMAGLILLGLISGAWSFSELSNHYADDTLPQGSLMVASFALIFAGAAAKSAQWPLHFWLPGAMVAPTPVSAYLHSATMVKAGVYLVGRFFPALASAVPQWGWVVAGFGALTMVLGSYIALRRTDLKQIFAYTTVSQLGLLMTMYGAAAVHYHGESNLIWDVTQILNHALYKAPLFLIAGAVAHAVGSRELADLRGLVHRSSGTRLLGIILILALYALAAGPFTVSFSAKEFFLYQLSHAWESTHSRFWIGVMVLAVATGAFNVAIFIRMTLVILSRQTSTAIATDEDHTPDSRFWQSMLWLPALLLVAMQYIGGVVPGAYETLFAWIERSKIYFGSFPLTWQFKLGLPLWLSLGGAAAGLLIGLSPLLRGVVRDVHDAIYPAFYALATRGGGRIFGLLQTGNLRTYLSITLVMLVLLVLWGLRLEPLLHPAKLRLPSDAVVEAPRDLLAGYLFTVLVCVSAVLMPLVRDRASRIIVLGMVGFTVTAVFYVYNAPDLALTQISIEIVSLILFLLVLSLLPRTEREARPRRLPRLAISLAVGAAMFWLALLSSTGARPGLTAIGPDAIRFDYLGQFFIRNSYESVDLPGRQGGGGSNVVNVILVDFRGLDTLGEILVLALAAVGVWTLLRRRARVRETHALHRNLSDVAAPESRIPVFEQPVLQESHT